MLVVLIYCARITVYDHHFFKCVEYNRNRCFFRKGVWRMYDEYVEAGHHDIPRDIVDAVLKRPCKMWVGLFDSNLFDLGLKLTSTSSNCNCGECAVVGSVLSSSVAIYL